MSLLDATPPISIEWGRDKDTIPFSVGSELNWIAHRLCVVANQTGGGAILRGMLIQDEYDYGGWSQTLEVDTLGPLRLPTAKQEESCPPSPPTTDLTSYPVAYKSELAGTGLSAVQDGYSTLTNRAEYTEGHMLYTRLRNQVLAIKQIPLLRFGQFVRLDGWPVPREIEEPALQDPPPGPD